LILKYDEAVKEGLGLWKITYPFDLDKGCVVILPETHPNPFRIQSLQHLGDLRCGIQSYAHRYRVQKQTYD